MSYISMVKDYYSVLGVPYGSPREVIKRAYHGIAFNNHPDRFPGDSSREEIFKEATEAYSVLENEDTRKEYNNLWEHYFSSKEDSSSGSRYRPPHKQYGPSSKEEDPEVINIQDIIREIFEDSKLNSRLYKFERIRDDSLTYIRDIVEKAESFGKSQNPTVISALETIANNLYDQETNSLVYDVAMSEIDGRPLPYENFKQYMKDDSSPEEGSSYNERPDVEGAFAQAINYDT